MSVCTTCGQEPDHDEWRKDSRLEPCCQTMDLTEFPEHYTWLHKEAFGDDGYDLSLEDELKSVSSAMNTLEIRLEKVIQRLAQS